MNAYIIFYFFSQLFIMTEVKPINSDMLRQLDELLENNKSIFYDDLSTNFKKNKSNPFLYNFYDPIAIKIYDFNTNDDTIVFSFRRVRSNYYYRFFKEISIENSNLSPPSEFFIYKRKLFVISYYKSSISKNIEMNKIRSCFFQLESGKRFLLPNLPLNKTYSIIDSRKKVVYFKFYNKKFISKEFF